MKTKQLTVLLLAVAFALSATAKEIPRMNVVAVDKTKTLIAAVTNPKVSAEVSVIAEDGEIVYYKKTKAAPEFRSVLDLSELKNGTYTMKLKTGKEYAQRKVELKDGTVRVLNLKQEVKPFFAYDGDMLKLSYLNVNKNDVSVSVYNGSKLVYELYLGDRVNINRAFDVSKMVKGKYDFVLAGNNQTYNYQITR